MHAFIFIARSSAVSSLVDSRRIVNEYYHVICMICTRSVLCRVPIYRAVVLANVEGCGLNSHRVHSQCVYVRRNLFLLKAGSVRASTAVKIDEHRKKLKIALGMPNPMIRAIQMRRRLFRVRVSLFVFNEGQYRGRGGGGGGRHLL